MYDRAAYNVGDDFSPPNILASGDYTTRLITIAEGEVLEPGAVLGTADGSEYVLSLAASDDGSEVPDLVLAQAADATDGTVEALAYETATLVGTALTLGTGHTIDSIREGLRVKGLLIH